MRVVETSSRPPRLAIAVSEHASNRVLRRAFRLVGGRWGGVFDVLVRVEPDQLVDDFYKGVLRLHDPDFVLVIDSRLDRYSWSTLLGDLKIQPFDVVRLRERAEYREYEHLFIEGPTVREADNPESVHDVDTPALTWRQAAHIGLPGAQTTRKRSANVAVPSPVDLGREALTARAQVRRWLVFANSGDIDMACRFWNLRALGARPLWSGPDALSQPQPPTRVLIRAYLYAGAAYESEARRAAASWAQGGRRVRLAPADPAEVLRPSTPYFASHVQAVTEHRGILRFSLPSPPAMTRPVQRSLVGIAEHRILSPNPGDPDGLVLSRDVASRKLVSRGARMEDWRVTRGGIAEIRPIHRPDLVAVHDVRYQDAIAAPLSEGGFTVEASDKGRYQQRTLELAGGLRFLAWCLRQRDSARLLALFDQYHGTGSPPPDYRRAVRFSELRSELHATLREKRGRLRARLIADAEAWLQQWTAQLLDRGLLVAGYVLACTECARRAFYPADDVGQRFTCQRCTSENLVAPDVQRAYQLNEAFYQMRLHHGDVVTLVLAALRGSAKASLLYQPEVILRGGNNSREIDAVALVDGDLVIAEAKSNNDLGNAEVKWYRFVAGRAPVSRVVFATTSRDRPLCAALDCVTCRTNGGVHHRDYAWSPSAQSKIADMRSRLSGRGLEVESRCFQALVAEHPDASAELATFDADSADA
jgi:hypothetical protein